MLKISRDDSRLVIVEEAQSFALVFERVGEHWAHHLGARHVCSVEADAELQPADTVVSPTYQDLHDQPADAAHRVFLVGQFGKHHFSSVFEIVSDESGVRVDVDVSDRCPHMIGSLASTYLLSECRIDACEDETLRLHVASGSDLATLSLHAVPPARAVARASDVATRTLTQVVAGIDPSARTHRWHYRWIWTKRAAGAHDG